jgi:hypothetical protein
MKIKKAAIITILDNQNIGTYLQAYALCNLLAKEGLKPEMINYQRKSRSMTNIAMHIFKNKKSFIHGLISVLYRIPIFFIVKRKCRSFLKSRVSFTKRYRSFNELKSDPPIADVYITGSDQVWNSIHNRGVDLSFFLQFVDSSVPKFSYASSIGMDRFPEKERGEVFSSLCEYDLISIREISAKHILEDIGIKNVTVVLDPTLLLSRKNWKLVADEDNFVKTEPYLLIYSVESERKDVIKDIAFKIAKEKGLKVYSITSDWFREGFGGDKSFYLAGPKRFVNLFMNADFAVVSSFHGTAFSVNFNIPFLSVTPSRFNSRVHSLLSMLNLESKIIREPINALKEAQREIDFKEVNKKLEEQRFVSLEFINKIHRSPL